MYILINSQLITNHPLCNCKNKLSLTITISIGSPYCIVRNILTERRPIILAIYSALDFTQSVHPSSGSYSRDSRRWTPASTHSKDIPTHPSRQLHLLAPIQKRFQWVNCVVRSLLTSLTVCLQISTSQSPLPHVSQFDNSWEMTNVGVAIRLLWHQLFLLQL